MPSAVSKDSLYSRLGGYDAIAAVVDDPLPRLREDARLRRFWTSPRNIDSNNRAPEGECNDVMAFITSLENDIRREVIPFRPKTLSDWSSDPLARSLQIRSRS
jgi:hypothetical protein